MDLWDTDPAQHLITADYDPEDLQSSRWVVIYPMCATFPIRSYFEVRSKEKLDIPQGRRAVDAPFEDCRGEPAAAVKAPKAATNVRS